MKKHDIKDSDLRRRAEKQLSERQISKDLHPQDEDLLKLIHELQVHHIELEMQNEELMQARSEIEVLLDKYAGLYDFAPMGYFTISDDGGIREVNLAGAALLGEDRSRLVNRRFDLFFGHETLAALHTFYKKVFESNTKQTCEVLLDRDKDNPRHIHLEGMAMQSSQPSLGSQCFMVALDITDQKRTEAALKESLDILAEAERIGFTGSWKRDLVTNQIIWSSGTHRIFGIPENEEISYETFKSLIHPEDRDYLLEKLEETANKGTPMAAEFRIILPDDGTIRHIVGRAETSLDPHGKPVLRGTVQDITQRKMLEAELIRAQQLKSIGTLAGGIAHDYNNLLIAILGYMELAKTTMVKTDTAYTLLSEAEKAALSSRDLTQMLITFSEGGNPRSKIMPIRDLITQSVRLGLSGANTKAEWKIADDLPEVKVDENQIRQVMHNIVINAREAMLQGGTLFIEADKTALGPDNALSLAEGVYVRLVFREEGPGVSAVNLPRIFDPYFTTKDVGKTKGMGLGLSICYSIIKKHAGHIMVDSEAGNGTTVTIYIPAAMDGKKSS
jgi:PAS domain S-box-containing protein